MRWPVLVCGFVRSMGWQTGEGGGGGGLGGGLLAAVDDRRQQRRAVVGQAAADPELVHRGARVLAHQEPPRLRHLHVLEHHAEDLSGARVALPLGGAGQGGLHIRGQHLQRPDVELLGRLGDEVWFYGRHTRTTYRGGYRMSTAITSRGKAAWKEE